MTLKIDKTKAAGAIAGAILIFAGASALAGDAESSKVAKWKDDKQGAFMLTFDDNLSSQVENVVPELKKRKLQATFYVNPGNGQWQGKKSVWEKTYPQEFPALGLEYGNHTMTHHGAKDVADFDDEIKKCNDVILKLFPGKQPRIVSYAMPGVKKEDWNISSEQEKQVIAKHNLIPRPEFVIANGGSYYGTGEHLGDLAKEAASKGTVKCVVFHGIGGNYLSVDVKEFNVLLDKLEAMREQLWITSATPLLKYVAERDAAEIKTLESDAKKMRLKLSCKLDASLYDMPLTLVTKVPAAWKSCQVSQGAAKVKCQPVDGAIKYDALPNGEPIVIQAE